MYSYSYSYPYSNKTGITSLGAACHLTLRTISCHQRGGEFDHEYESRSAEYEYSSSPKKTYSYSYLYPYSKTKPVSPRSAPPAASHSATWI